MSLSKEQKESLRSNCKGVIFPCSNIQHELMQGKLDEHLEYSRASLAVQCAQAIAIATLALVLIEDADDKRVQVVQ